MYSDVFDSVRTQISLQGETESLNNSIFYNITGGSLCSADYLTISKCEFAYIELTNLFNHHFHNSWTISDSIFYKLTSDSIWFANTTQFINCKIDSIPLNMTEEQKSNFTIISNYSPSMINNHCYQVPKEGLSGLVIAIISLSCLIVVILPPLIIYAIRMKRIAVREIKRSEVTRQILADFG